MSSHKPDPDNLKLGAEIKALRSKAGKTQEEVAAHNGCSRQLISLYENGKCSIKYSRYKKITEYLINFLPATDFAEEQEVYTAAKQECSELTRMLKIFKKDMAARVDEMISASERV